MCQNLRRFCECRRNSAHLSFRDNLLPPEIVLHLFCPECRDLADWGAATMIQDCGWVLEFDVERAQGYFDLRGLKVTASPEFLFDEGYATWQGFAPGDQDLNRRLHERLAPLISRDMAQYLTSLRREWMSHVAGLKAAGWRKAQAS